jgi:hypothetical protein
MAQGIHDGVYTSAVSPQTRLRAAKWEMETRTILSGNERSTEAYDQDQKVHQPRSKPMTNITDIRDSLIEVFDKLRDGDMDLKQAAEINNTAGKIINTAKVQLAYAALRGEQPVIPFLNTVATTSVPKLMEL